MSITEKLSVLSQLSSNTTHFVGFKNRKKEDRTFFPNEKFGGLQKMQ